MSLSRYHILMLAVLSLFTGIIAPSVSNGEYIQSYALTNIEYISYGVLILLTGLFFCASMHWRKSAEILSYILILLVFIMLLMTFAGFVQSFEGDIMHTLSWGWIFLSVGIACLIFGTIEKEEELEPFQSIGILDHIVGICGVIVFLGLTTFIIYVSQMSTTRTYEGLIARNFGSDMFTSSGEITISRAFSGIVAFQFEKTHDRIVLITRNSDSTISWQGHTDIAFPQDVIRIAHIGDMVFFIHNDNAISTLHSPKQGEFLKIDASTIIWKNHENIFTRTDNEERIFSGTVIDANRIQVAQKSKDIFWVEGSEGGMTLKKNGEILLENIPTIHSIAVSSDGDSWMSAIEQDGVVSIIHNGRNTGSLRTNRIPGTVQMNGHHYLYQVQNEDKSISLVYDGTLVDKKLDAVYEVFLDHSGLGYALFGRPQGENILCAFTRYRGNLCNLSSYMSPAQEGNGVGVIYAGERDGVWKMYRNSTSFIDSIPHLTGILVPPGDTSLFFFDPTTPHYYLTLKKEGDGNITVYKQGKQIPGKWKHVDINTITFGYRGKVLFTAESDEGWHVVEI